MVVLWLVCGLSYGLIGDCFVPVLWLVCGLFCGLDWDCFGTIFVPCFMACLWLALWSFGAVL